MIKARVNWLILVAIAFPAFIFIPPAINNLKSAYKPVVRDGGRVYIVCGAYDCNDYEKKIIDAPSKQGELNYLDREFIRIKDSYERDISFATQTLAGQKKLGIFYAVIAGLYVLVAGLYWPRNTIVLENDIIKIKHYLRFTQKGFFGRTSTYGTKTSNDKEIPLDQIIKISVVTTTPLVPVRTNINQLNWRDRIEIEFKDKNGNPDSATIELYIFPKFKKIVQYITEKFPQLPIAFSKTTLIQNLKDYPPAF